MKKIYCLLLLIAAAGSLQAQSWFQNHPAWTNFFSFGFAGTGHEDVSVQGDTVVQGFTAVALKRTRYLSATPGSTDVRIVRQQGDTLRTWNGYTQQWYVLYNFSLAAGDSVSLPVYWDDSDHLVYRIDSVGTLVIDGVPLRFQRVRFAGPNSGISSCHTLFIEKIGMVNGQCAISAGNTSYGGHFFLDEPNEGFVDGTEWAICRYHSDDLDYQDAGINVCSGLLGVQDARQEADLFQVWPNPFHDRFSIAAKKDQAPANLRLFDAAGHLILNLPAPVGAISAAALPAGLYFLEITSRTGGRQFSKIVKE